MASYQPYGSFAAMLASLKNRSQLTGTKYSKKDISNLGSGYFADALNASNTDRAWDLQNASQTLAEKAQAAQEAQNAATLALSGKQFDIQQATNANQFAQTLAEQKRIADAQQNAQGEADAMGNVQTGLSAGLLGTKLYGMADEAGKIPWKTYPGNETTVASEGMTGTYDANTLSQPGMYGQEGLPSEIASYTPRKPESVFTTDAPVFTAPTTPVIAETGPLGTPAGAQLGGYGSEAELGGGAITGLGAGSAQGVGGMTTATGGILGSAEEGFAAVGAGAGSAVPAAAGETLSSVLGPLGAAYGLWDLGVTLGGGQSPTGAAVNQLVEQVPNVINQAGGQLSSLFGGGVQNMGPYGIYGSYGNMMATKEAMDRSEAERQAKIDADNRRMAEEFERQHIFGFGF